jgi:hypothetical protein
MRSKIVAVCLLAGATFIQTMRNRQNDGQLLSVLLTTEYPSSPMPDQVVLSWVLDPRTTQTVTWRNDTTVTDATLFYQEKRFVRSFSTQTPIAVKAQTTRPTLRLQTATTRMY